MINSRSNNSTMSDSESIANLPDESLPAMCDVTQTGVYYGYAQIYSPRGGPALHSDDAKVLPMVMSLGWNPFYMNKRMTAVDNYSTSLR